MTTIDADLVRDLLAANARYWAAEATIVDAYWGWEGRSLDTDLRWLERQCHKELVDGVLVRLAALEDAVAGPLDRHPDVVRAAAGVRTEHAHLGAFAAVHRTWAPPGVGPLDPASLRWSGWRENDELMALRRRHRADHRSLGARAFALTEGGGGALYASGASLVGRSGIDGAIGAACAGVADDERDHLVEGLEGLVLSADELRLLRELTVAQGRLRLRMRWAQFGGPIAEDRLEDLVANGDTIDLEVVDDLLGAAGLG